MKKQIIMMATALVMLTACQESLEERAAREAREVTEKKCPMPVGDWLVLDSIVFDIPSLTQTQYFRLVGDADVENPIEDVAVARQALVNELKNTPNYRALMERGVNFRYVYFSTVVPGELRFDTTLTPEDYR